MVMSTFQSDSDDCEYLCNIVLFQAKGGRRRQKTDFSLVSLSIFSYWSNFCERSSSELDICLGKRGDDLPYN